MFFIGENIVYVTFKSFVINSDTLHYQYINSDLWFNIFETTATFVALDRRTLLHFLLLVTPSHN